MIADPILIPGETDLERLVARSRLIGGDPELVVHGGGNTSTETRETDHLGRERPVLRIKGSGTDLKTIGPDGFPGLWLDELLPLRERAAMSDEAMVAHLARCMTDPAAPKPSIETLLHAFLPARHVDHVHADAICALTNNPEPERHVREALGPEVAVVPYLRPGFGLSRMVAELAGAKAVVLAKHGLVTWGETDEESLGLTLDLVARAEAYLAERLPVAEPVQSPAFAAEERRDLLLTLRGRLSRDRRVVLVTDASQQPFADRPDVETVATAGRATPDHILRIGARSAVVRGAAEAGAVVDAFEANYRTYFARHADRLPSGLGMLPPLPKVILVPGLGAVAAGPDAKTARVNAEVAYRSHRVTATVLDAFGAVAWLSEEDVFDVDYWPLELRKLAGAPPPREFAGRVVLVAEAASAVGRVVAGRLAGEGAHLVLADSDGSGLDEVRAALPPGSVAETLPLAEGRGLADAVNLAIDAFGGIDGLVLAGPADPEAIGRFADAVATQGIGGGLVLLGDGAALAGARGRLAAAASVRANAIDSAATADPTAVAEAVAFLLSSRAAGTAGATLPVS